jgi:hypothetical protein
MENIKTTFIFEDGYIHGFDVKSRDRHVLSAMEFIDSTLRPTIEKNNISGMIQLRIFNGTINMAYMGIHPFIFAPELIKLINTTP